MMKLMRLKFFSLGLWELARKSPQLPNESNGLELSRTRECSGSSKTEGATPKVRSRNSNFIRSKTGPRQTKVYNGKS